MKQIKFPEHLGNKPGPAAANVVSFDCENNKTIYTTGQNGVYRIH